MPKSAHGEHNKSLRLTTEYTTPYSALIRDEIVMGVTRYFLERWLPVLGTAPATVVNTLRQLDYHCEGNGITITGEALAHEAAMSRRYLYTCLNTPWVCAFVQTQSGQRVRKNSGKIVQQTNRYYIRMDDPLTPADSDRLLRILTDLADDPIEAARRALTYTPADLWATDPTQPSSRFTTPRPITAHDVLHRAFPTWQPDNDEHKRVFAELAEALHRHVTLVREDGRTSKIIIPQYFRHHWWKHLGHDLAWSYLWLRGRVYDNPQAGTRRNTCWIPSLNALLDIIQRPREWWRRNVEKAKEHPEGWSITDFFKQIDAQKGRNPTHPQWVARQFTIAFEIPIAPEDRTRYEELLRTWQGKSLAPDTLWVDDCQGSTTSVHTNPTEVRHIHAHRLSQYIPYPYTPVDQGSATIVHADSERVCHNRTQRSATPAHRKSELKAKAPAQDLQAFSNSKYPGAAAAATNSEENFEGKHSLFNQLADAFEQTPHVALHQAVDALTWLQQTWPEPVRPHTPAWTTVTNGQIAIRDLVALILAIWADASIKYPPRYLSWLIQRWQILPNTPPVDHWERWQFLADLSLDEWGGRGRQEWLELTSRDNRTLPFGLDAFIEHQESSRESGEYVLESKEQEGTISVDASIPEPANNGLDERPGGGALTILDVWRATLGQLRLQLNRSTYTNWVEGTKAVSYADGVLTVRARHVMARDLLAQRLNVSIEATASALAQQPITIRYTTDSPVISEQAGSNLPVSVLRHQT